MSIRGGCARRRLVRRLLTTSIACADITAFAEQAVFRACRPQRRSGRHAGERGRHDRDALVLQGRRGRAATGSHLHDQEGEAGDEFAVVISDSFWRNHFGGEASVVGRSLRLDGRPYTVMGVMPSGFNPTDDDIELWTPIIFTPKEKSDEARHSNTVAYFARLRPGATLEQAQAQIDVLNAANLDRFPAFREVLVNAGFHTVVNRLQDQMVKDVESHLVL